jgi:hypothetical protein
MHGGRKSERDGMTTVDELIKFLEEYRGFSVRTQAESGSFGLEFVPRLSMAEILVRPVSRQQSFLIRADL